MLTPVGSGPIPSGRAKVHKAAAARPSATSKAGHIDSAIGGGGLRQDCVREAVPGPWLSAKPIQEWLIELAADFGAPLVGVS